MFGIGMAELFILVCIFGGGVVFVGGVCLVIFLATRAGNRNADDHK